MKSVVPPILASLLILPGCLNPGEGGGPVVEDPSAESGTTDEIAPRALEEHRASLRRLSAAPLAEAGASELTGSADGRALLEYVARCALEEGTGVTAGGEVYPGLLGLAPGWLEGSCDGSCQRWVSACLLAHANLRDGSVPISLRGPHPALEPSDYALETFAVREAGFYGNVFVDDAEMFGCIGDGLVEVDAGLEADDVREDYLAARLCGGGACAVEQTGACWTPRESAGACGFDAGALGGYSECVTGAAYDELYIEVVTVHLPQ